MRDKDTSKNKGNRRGAATAPIMMALGIFLAVVAAGAVLVLAWTHGYLGNSDSLTGSPGVLKAPANLNTQCSQNPAYSFSAVDKFAAGTTVLGTDSIKSGTDAPVASLANPNAGAGLQYWKNNASWFCTVKSGNANCGSNTFQTTCIQNATPTLSLYDQDLRATITAGGGAQNITMGTNAVKNLEFSYQVAAKKAAMPFGGCMVIEANANVTDIVVNGLGITPGCKFPITYTVGATTNTYKTFTVPEGFDADGAGDLKRPTIQLKTGGSDPTISTMTISMIPADYYVTNTGDFALGVEADKNSDTTRQASAVTTTAIIQ